MRLAVATLFIGVGVALSYRIWFAPQDLALAPGTTAQPRVRPYLEIDTNAVLGDVLEGISDTVNRLKLPLATPWTADQVLRFETRPVLLGRPSSLRRELVYDGGY